MFFLSFFLKKIKNNDCKLLAKTKTISLDELLHIQGYFHSCFNFTIYLTFKLIHRVKHVPQIIVFLLKKNIKKEKFTQFKIRPQMIREKGSKIKQGRLFPCVLFISILVLGDLLSGAFVRHHLLAFEHLSFFFLN